MTQPITPASPNIPAWDIDVPHGRCLTVDDRTGRARVRILDGTETPDGLWAIGGWTIGVCGWSGKDFAKAYTRKHSPQADNWVRVIDPDGNHYFRLCRTYPRSTWVASRDIGYATYDAIKAGKALIGAVPLTDDVERELKSFCKGVIDEAFQHGIRTGRRLEAEQVLLATEAADADGIGIALDAAQAAHALGIQMTFDEAVAMMTGRTTATELSIS